MSWEWSAPPTSKLRVKVTIGDSTKFITISGFNANGNFSDAVAVLDAVLVEIGGSSYDVHSIRKISVWDVVNNEWVEVIFIASDIAPIFNNYQPSGSVFSASNIAQIFNDYQPSGNVFSASDITPIFSGTHQLSY